MTLKTLTLATMAALAANASAQTLNNGSFEIDGPGFVIFEDWQNFGNVFAADSGETAPLDGVQMAKMFGASNGDQSDQVLLQQVTGLTEGTLYTLSANVKNITGDALGDENVILIQIQFQDAAGDPIETLETDAYEVGVDPLDTWVMSEVSGIAPTGTTQAQIALLHIQLGTEAGFPTQGGGASFWDDVQFSGGEPPCMNPADLNGDGETSFVDVGLFLNAFSEGCP